MTRPERDLRQPEARRHRGAQLPAGLEVIAARVAEHRHRRLRAAPLQPCAIASIALTAPVVSLLPWRYRP